MDEKAKKVLSDLISPGAGGPQRVLVTGGAGFIGSHLCRRLIGLGHEVLAVDNFSSSSRRNVHDLLGEPRFELIRHDVTFPLYVEVDQIYHLACPASPIHYQRDPVQTTKTCVVGSLNMLGVAKRLGAPILLASTSEVYGDPAVHPQQESYWGNVNPVGPRSCYDEGKRCAETLFFDYHRQHGLKIKVARIFNTYGPRMHPNDGRVVSSFVVQALSGAPLTLHGDGSQTRSFCYVDDTVEGLIRLMNSPAEVTGPVNVGNPDEFTMLELAKKVLAATGSSSPVEYHPLPVDDPVRRRPDIAVARELLGWEPAVPFHEGIARTVDYFRAELPVMAGLNPRRGGTWPDRESAAALFRALFLRATGQQRSNGRQKCLAAVRAATPARTAAKRAVPRTDWGERPRGTGGGGGPPPALPKSPRPRGRRARGILFLDRDRQAKESSEVAGEFDDDNAFLLLRVGAGHNGD